MTARLEAEVLNTLAPEVTENSLSQQEQSNPPLVDQEFSLFKTYLASPLEEKSKQFEGKSKAVKEAAEFKFKGNRKQFELNARHRGEGGAGGALAPPPPPLFWLIKLLFQFFSKVLQKKVHRVILCQTCGPQRKHCFFLIAPFRSNTLLRL